MKKGYKEVNCHVCKIAFNKRKAEINRGKSGLHFCSKKCDVEYKKSYLRIVECKYCKKQFTKQPRQIKRTTNNFCSKSCAATYNNQHQKQGIRRSKLEKYLEEQLSILFPWLQIDYNKKDAINSELDIFIPSLKLAFELNGIFHYEPIYGIEKLSQIKNNDDRKMQACFEKGISMCIIDTSRQIYFKESTSRQFLNIITDVIKKNLPKELL